MKTIREWFHTLTTWGDFSFASSGPGTEKPGIQPPLVIIEGGGHFLVPLDQRAAHSATLEHLLHGRDHTTIHSTARFEEHEGDARIAVRTLAHGELLGHVPLHLHEPFLTVVHSTLHKRGVFVPSKEWTARLSTTIRRQTEAGSRITTWIDLPANTALQEDLASA